MLAVNVVGQVVMMQQLIRAGLLHRMPVRAVTLLLSSLIMLLLLLILGLMLHLVNILSPLCFLLMRFLLLL